MGTSAFEGNVSGVPNCNEPRTREGPRTSSACVGSCIMASKLVENVVGRRSLTAHFAPTIQLPPITSPFFRTARRASAGLVYPILKQFEISVFWSGSVESPSERKYSTVTLYLSKGYPKTIT